MATSSKIDKAIAKAKFIVKKKKGRIDELSRRSDLNESQKIFIGEETELIQIVELLISSAKIGFDVALGKLPAQAVDMEEAVLGALMLENAAMGKVISFLRAEHFYVEAHRLIYSAINTMAIAEYPIDMRTVVSALRRSGDIETIGGAAYIAELTSKVSSAANIEFHARTMVEMAIKRQVGILAGNALAAAYDDQKDCFVLLEDLEEGIKEVNSWIKK